MKKCFLAAWAVIALLTTPHFVSAEERERSQFGSSGNDIDGDFEDGIRIDGRRVYSLTNLGTLWSSGGYSHGHAINNNGQAVGEAFTGSYDGAFVYSGAPMVRIPGFGGDMGFAYGINSGGRVTGHAALNFALNELWGFRAFLYGDGVSKSLGTLGGLNSVGRGINDRGWITGWSSVQPGSSVQHAFLYRNGVLPQEWWDMTGLSLKDLGTLGGTNSQGWAINSRGQVTGQAQTAGDAATRAFVYDGGPLRDLGTLGGTNSFGRAINHRGEIVGYASIAGDAATHAFLYTGGALKDLGTLGGTDSFAFGINARGQIVGNSKTKGNAATHAFIYDNGKMFDLNDLVDASGSGWTLTDARGINDHGQIVGTATRSDLGERAVVLTLVRSRWRRR